MSSLCTINWIYNLICFWAFVQDSSTQAVHISNMHQGSYWQIEKASTSSKMIKEVLHMFWDRSIKSFQVGSTISLWNADGSSCKYYLPATERAIFSQQSPHSLSLKKPITDCIHSFKATEKPWSWRSKKMIIMAASRSTASEVEKIVLTLL